MYGNFSFPGELILIFPPFIKLPIVSKILTTFFLKMVKPNSFHPYLSVNQKSVFNFS